jgi:hypothetical protein
MYPGQWYQDFSAGQLPSCWRNSIPQLHGKTPQNGQNGYCITGSMATSSEQLIETGEFNMAFAQQREMAGRMRAVSRMRQVYSLALGRRKSWMPQQILNPRQLIACAQVYSLALGRRKSWIVPIQATSGVALLLCANWADARLQVMLETGPSAINTQLWLWFVWWVVRGAGGCTDVTSGFETGGTSACLHGMHAHLRNSFDRSRRAPAGGRRGGNHHAVLRPGAAGGDAGHRGRRLGADAAVAPPRRVSSSRLLHP